MVGISDCQTVTMAYSSLSLEVYGMTHVFNKTKEPVTINIAYPDGFAVDASILPDKYLCYSYNFGGAIRVEVTRLGDRTLRGVRAIVAFDRSVIITVDPQQKKNSGCSIVLQEYGAQLHVEDAVQVRRTREQPSFGNGESMLRRAIAGMGPPRIRRRYRVMESGSPTTSQASITFSDSTVKVMGTVSTGGSAQQKATCSSAITMASDSTKIAGGYSTGIMDLPAKILVSIMAFLDLKSLISMKGTASIFEYLAEKHCHLMKSVKVNSLDVIVDSDGQGKFIFDAVHRYPSLYYEAPFDAQRLYSNLCHMRLEDNFHVYWAVDPEPLFTALAQLPSVIFGGNLENISFGGLRSDESGNVISQFIRQHSSIRSIRLQNDHTKEDIEKMARSIRNPVCFSVVSCMEMSRSSTPISDDILQHFLQPDTSIDRLVFNTKEVRFTMRSLVDVLKAWLDVTRESTWRGNGRFDFAQVIGTHRDFKSQLAVILPARWPNAVIEHQPVGRRWHITVKLSNFAQRRFEVLAEFIKS